MALLCSTHMISSSLDISFKLTLTMSVFSIVSEILALL